MNEKMAIVVDDVRRHRVPVHHDHSRNSVPDAKNILVEKIAVHIDDVCLAPGNIILSEGETKKAALLIQSYQRLIEPAKVHYTWTHVGIIGKDRFIFDIVPGKNVRRVTLAEFIADKRTFGIRRLRNASIDADKLQRNIDLQMHATYPPMNRRTFEVYRKNIRALDRAMPEFGIDEFNCSLFVDRVIRATLKTNPCPDALTPIVLPAHFASSNSFESLPVLSMLFTEEP